MVIDQKPIRGPGSCLYAWLTNMDANHETTIFNISQLHAALGRLDLDEVAKRTIELAEDYMPGCAWLDAQGNALYGETLREIEGLVLCMATEGETEDEVDEDSDERSEGEVDDVPFWVASWLDELFPDIAGALRAALALAVGTGSAPDVD